MNGWGMDGALYLVPVVLLVTSLRALPSIFRTEHYAADEAFHIYLADEIRQNSHRIPDEYEQLLPPTAVHYPSLVHWLVSFLPNGAVVTLSAYFGVLVDAMHALVIMTLAFWVFDVHAPGVSTGKAIILSGAVFVLTPKLVTGRPLTARLHLGGRAPGNLLLTCSIGGYIGWSLTGHVLLLVIAVVGAGLVALTSSFSTQTLALLYIVFSTIFLDPVPLVILIGGGLVASVLSGGRYWGTFRAHTGTLRFYYRVFEQKRAARFKDSLSNYFYIRDRIRNLWLFVRQAPSWSQLKSRLMAVFQYVYTHHVAGSYLQLPFVIFVPLLLASGEVQSVWRYLLVWVLALLGANAVIATPGVPGKPAHRYTEYLVAPLSILAAYAFFTIGGETGIPFVGSVSLPLLLIFLLGVYSLSMIGINVAIDVLISPPAELSLAVDFLGEMDEQRHVFAIPGAYGKRVLPETNHVHMQCIHDHFATSDGRCECVDLFASIDGRVDLQRVHEKFGIDYVLGDTQQIDEQCGGEFEQVFESGDVGVFAYESTEGG